MRKIVSKLQDVSTLLTALVIEQRRTNEILILLLETQQRANSKPRITINEPARL